jgi:hypothetical protein
MLILACVLFLELVTAVFLGFGNFQKFLEESEQNSALPRLSARPLAESSYQTRIEQGNNCTREGKSRDLIYDLAEIKCSNLRRLMREKERDLPLGWKEEVRERMNC